MPKQPDFLLRCVSGRALYCGLLVALTVALVAIEDVAAGNRGPAIFAKLGTNRQSTRFGRVKRMRPECCPCANQAADNEPAWRPLFDGKSLAGWTITNFGGEGEVTVEAGKILMAMGSSLTGITYKGSMPKSDYEIRLEAMRTAGIDFFAGLTFPVGESHCSFIASGWAGAIVGLSSIDGQDASDNETTQFMNFKDYQWYRFRVRVTDEAIQVWIDDKQVIDQNIVGRKITTRAEVDLSKPLGISAWETSSALRNIEIRELAK